MAGKKGKKAGRRKSRAKKIYAAIKRSAKKRRHKKKGKESRGGKKRAGMKGISRVIKIRKLKGAGKKKKEKKKSRGRSRKKLVLLPVAMGKKKKPREKFSAEMNSLLRKMEERVPNPDIVLIKNVFGFLNRVNVIRKSRETALVRKAFSYSKKKHGKQKRASGDPYFTHLIGTAMIASDYSADNETIAAALLHDVLEDTDTGEKELVTEFGGEVAGLVSSLTRLDKLTDERKDENQVKYLRKLILASSKDARVLLIKLADKLHNLRTVEFLPEVKRKGICRQALEVYAPLARELGFSEIESEMQDICLKVLYPQEFREVEKIVSNKRAEKKREIKKATEMLKAEMERSKKKTSSRFGFKTEYKNLYSVYKKTIEANKTPEEIYDYATLVILANSADECYEALRFVHSAFYPIPSKLKDFIAMPSRLNYRAIHTSVIGPGGKPIKVHIKTRESAHAPFRVLLPKKKPGQGIEIPKIRVGEEEFLDALKSDYLKQRINIFTEKGDIVSMPSSSTVLDFAFKTAPKEALKTSGGTVNGKRVPIWEKLGSGDRVSVLFANRRTVKRDWLEFVKSYEAKEIISDFLKTPRETGEPLQPVCITLLALNRPSLLSDVGKAFSELNLPLDSLHGQKASAKTIRGSFTVLVKNVKQLKKVRLRLGEIRGVKRVEID